ncbi:MAG TPA: GntR family transcriptional regulator [Candidatus Avilachnospira avistercoris]|nr:GntR family transcriptional regulator [Candidatus Avilachnospira avistercoris]
MISLDYKDKRPLYEQISEKLKDLMAVGGLPENSQLPSVRSLAIDLSINPNTIQRAYAELEKQGYIYSIKGKGNFVADTERLQYLKIAELRGRLSSILEEAFRLGLNDEEILRLIKNIISERGAIA